MFEIVVERGGVVIHRFTVRGDMTIGRVSSAQIVLDAPEVNRAHARLVIQNGQLMIIDLDSANGTIVDGRRLRGAERLDVGKRVQIGPFTLRRAETGALVQPNVDLAAASGNSALDETTGPDDGRGLGGAPPLARVEVTDHGALQAALAHVKLGRHFVFVDDAQAVMPPSGRLQRLLGYKQKKGRVVKPLADAVVEIAGAKIHPAPVEVERLAGLVCDRDLYRAEQDVVRLLAAMPGGGAATIKITMDGAPYGERAIDLPRGLALESLAMLLPGKYAAQLVVAGKDIGEPARFTVAAYTLAPLSARLLDHKIDRASQTLAITLAIESYAVPWDRPLRAALVEQGREMSEIVLTMERPGRYTGKARVIGDGPFKVRVASVDDAARVAEVALPGTRRRERSLTLAGELGKEIHVSLMPEPGAIAVRGLHLTSGDFLATPIVIDDVVGDRASFRANEDIESLVISAYDPARDGFEIFDLGDIPRGRTAEIDVPRPMCVAFVGCFVNGEPFEAFTSLFTKERPVTIEVPEAVAPGAEIAVTVHTGRRGPVSMLLCIRDERLTATDTPHSALAASTKRALETATAGLGDDFRFAALGDLIEPPPPPMPPTSPDVGLRGGAGSTYQVVITEKGGRPRWESFEQHELTFGRVQGNDLVLPRGNISKRHARVVFRDGKFIIVDLKSTNGTFVNGKRLLSPQVLRDSDKIYIGDFTIQLRGGPRAVSGLEQSYAASIPRGAQPIESLDDLLDAPSASVGGVVDDGAIDLGLADDISYASRPSERALLDGGDEEDLSVAEKQSESLADDFDEEREASVELAAPKLRAARADYDDEIEPTRALKTGAGAPPPRPAALELSASPAAQARAKVGADAAARAGGGADEVRATFPEVLFCGLVDVGDGEQIRVPAGDSLGAFVVEAFFVDAGDFGEARARVQVDKPVRADLDLAPEIDPDDKVQGTLRVACKGGSVRARLVCSGKDVPLRTHDGRAITSSDALPSGTELVFDAGPGVWLATAEDPATGDIDSMEVRVGAPGVYRMVAREIVLLDKGKKLTLDGDMLSMRVLPGIDEPFTMLAEATAGYGHMCCEQTAAKILSAVVMLLTADKASLRQRAEEVILSGIARERSMYRRGRGFSMYPEQTPISDYYTPKVVEYLWSLDGLADLAGLSRQLTDAVREGLAMADDVAHAFAMKKLPERVESVEDAYRVAVRDSRRHREALELVARTLVLDDSGPRLRAPLHRVAERATLAYAAAVLFAAGKTQTAIRLANDVLKQLNSDGRLYSTTDSVAAIALMVQLRKTGIVGGGAELVVNGKLTTAIEASAFADQAEVVEVREGVCVLEVTRAKEERWAEARSTFPLKVGFRDHAGRPTTRFKKGDRAELVVALPKGYSEGDLVHVCLPPAMAWLEGGGRVKRFSADFKGRDEVRIPLVVTHAINGKQRFAVAVRNMFQEERAATPGLMVIENA